MLSKEEIEKAKSLFEAEVESEQSIYNTVNEYTQIKYDTHKTILDYVKELEKNNYINNSTPNTKLDNLISEMRKDGSNYWADRIKEIKGKV